MPSIKLNGKPIAFNVRTSKRAKRISVRYSLQKGLEVVYPSGMQQPTPETLLLERTDWILAVIDKFADAQANLPRRDYREGEVFLYRGASFKLLLERSATHSNVSVRLADGFLTVAAPVPPPNAEKEDIREAVISFYRREAQRYLPNRVGELAETYGFEYEQVRIKNQKTRWGSCSSKRNINLNLRLMMATSGAIDYVIIHELCHLRELNHTPAFWSLVEAYCPDYRRWKDWFRQHGPSLIL